MIPYLIYDDYAGLGSQVGFIFGGFMVLALFFTFFCVPECKGKTLEEVDILFRMKVPLRDFGKFDMSLLSAAAEGSSANKHNEKSFGFGDDVEAAERHSTTETTKI